MNKILPGLKKTGKYKTNFQEFIPMGNGGMVEW
jgi:hypothetical protein